MQFLDESVIDETGFCRKVKSGRRIANAIRYLVNARDFKLKYTRSFNDTLLVSVLMYGSNAMMYYKININEWIKFASNLFLIHMK